MIGLAKDLGITMLLDVYGQLLTEKQRLVIDMYYNEDLSLAEIAGEISISRQGVRESIKQGERHLLEYEEQLGVVKRFKNISAQLDILNEFLKNFGGKEREKLCEIADKIAKEI